jgi:hypothetical protein
MWLKVLIVLLFALILIGILDVPVTTQFHRTFFDFF